MGSLIEELRRREEAARAEADRLRARIEELTEELARAEEQVSRLAITREEVTRVLEEPPAADTAWQDGGPGGEPGHAQRTGALAIEVLRRDHPDLAGDRVRPAPGHAVRHGDGDPVRLAEAGSARLPSRRRIRQAWSHHVIAVSG